MLYSYGLRPVDLHRAVRVFGSSCATPPRTGRRSPAGVPFAYRVYWFSHSGHSDHSSQGTAPLASATHPILTKPRRSSSVQVPKSTTVPQSCRIAAGLMLPKASRQSSYISGLYTVETSPGLASPLNPATPCGPTEPCKPAGPCGPTEPCGPTGPCKPTGPLGPSGPVCPSAVGWHAMAPDITTARINSNALEAFMFLPPLFLQLLSSLLRGTTPEANDTPAGSATRASAAGTAVDKGAEATAGGGRARGFWVLSRAAWRGGVDVSLAVDLVEATHQQLFVTSRACRSAGRTSGPFAATPLRPGR